MAAMPSRAHIDPSTTMPVREAHAMDTARLEQWLAERLTDAHGLTIQQFRGGQSNPTYLLSTVGGRYVLRRKPPGALLPSAQEFYKFYGLTEDKLAAARPDAIVLHPGPMNRGVEIDSTVADGKQSVILPQVTFGIAIRMAVMSILAGNK